MARFLARVVSTAIATTSLFVYSWYELKAITSLQLSSDLWYRRVGYLGGLVVSERAGMTPNLKLHINKVTSAPMTRWSLVMIGIIVFIFRML